MVRDTTEYKKWRESIEDEGAEIKIARAGQKIKWARSDTEQFLEILYPSENLIGQELKNSNNTSIVSRLVFNENSFLFTGDIQKSVEKDLINKTNVDSDVLKVAHHGSKTSSSEEFLEKVSPEIAVIPVGENRYGHPHLEALKNLEKFAKKVLRTDQDGDIKIISDGKNLTMIKK